GGAPAAGGGGGGGIATAGLVRQPWDAARDRQRDVTASIEAVSDCLSFWAWASALAFFSAAAWAWAGDGGGSAALAIALAAHAAQTASLARYCPIAVIAWLLNDPG